MNAREHAEEMKLVSRARDDGDRGAFDELAAGYVGELRAHCYRMLGSVHDAEDAVQDALLRAWKGLSGFQGRGSVRSWLYSIATHTALDVSHHRSRRELPVDFGPSTGAGADMRPPLTDVPWLEPFPDRSLPGGPAVSPEERIVQRESVELAFVAALQHLPPLQRAVLLLREVVGFSTAEISSRLGTSAPSVNSALQRARASMQARTPARSQARILDELGPDRTRALAQRYADALERGDVDTLISMLTDGATWSMPPRPDWYRGLAAVRDFLLRYPLPERWRHRVTAANGQLAVACYLFDPAADAFVPAVVDVLTLEGEKIAAVTAFLAAEALGDEPSASWTPGAELFARFGLPPTAP